MGIRAHIDDPIVELVDNDDFTSPLDGYVKAPSFIIRARHIGVTTLYVSLMVFLLQIGVIYQ